MDQPSTQTMGKLPGRATTGLVTVAERRQKGRFPAREGGFSSPLKQACRNACG